MQNRSLLTACLVLVGLLVFGTAQARELKIAYESGPTTLDIHEQLSDSVLKLSHLSFDPLIRWTSELAFEPRLATAYQRLNPTTVRFTLRRGVRFHSGNTMTARDVKWTFDRLRSSADYQAIFAGFVELRIIDDYTIELVTRDPDPLLLNAATYIFPMDSKFYTGTDEAGNGKNVIIKNGDSFASTHLSGTGPYRVTSSEQGARIVFDRFADYWDQRSPGNVSRIVLTPIEDDQARVAALFAGTVDLIAPVPLADFGQIRSSSSVELITIPGTRIIGLQMNQQRRPEFRDQRVRLAMALAINNEDIVRKTMQGFATTAAQFSPSGYLGHNPKLKPRYDLALARKLMQDSGHENGFGVTMMAPNDRYINDGKIAQEVASMLSRINIRVDLLTLPETQYSPAFDDRAADIMMIGWHSDTEDSANFFEFLAMTPNPSTGMGAYNAGNYSSEYVDQMTVQSNAETDPKKRSEMLQSIEARIYQDAAFIPLHWENLAWAARKGVRIAPVVNALNLPYLGDLVID
ncbi:MAG: ABC transporter substrate-binding protein [Gammaproteobacteria bacterium]|nr:ABC transporter substrate-binding protein [Gammaproteobacteria bacterium]MDH3447720.1 ABC transporter substrate-binding protein [Gammaproteobacteria bacterium]